MKPNFIKFISAVKPLEYSRSQSDFDKSKQDLQKFYHQLVGHEGKRYRTSTCDMRSAFREPVRTMLLTTGVISVTPQSCLTIWYLSPGSRTGSSWHGLSNLSRLTAPVTAIIDSATGNYLREKTYVSFHPLQAYRSVKWEVCDDRLSTHQWLILGQPIN